MTSNDSFYILDHSIFIQLDQVWRRDWSNLFFSATSVVITYITEEDSNLESKYLRLLISKFVQQLYFLFFL